jgi:hypothetical protein
LRIKYLAVIISIFSIAACSQIKDFNDNQLENKIISEYKNWDNQGITSYRAEIEESSVWYSLTIAIEVHDNQVVKLQINCGDALLDIDGSLCSETASTIQADEYTISGLFKRLKNSRSTFYNEYTNKFVNSSWHESLSIQYDPTYHYPKMINYDIPDVVDEENYIDVINFEILH